MACILLFLFIWGTASPAQDPQNVLSTLSLFEKREKIEGKSLETPHQLLYSPIIPDTDKVWIDGALKLRDVGYAIDYRLGQLVVKTEFTPDSIIRIDYQVIPIAVKKTYRRQLFAPVETPSPEKEKTPETVYIDHAEESPGTLTFSGAKTVSLSLESMRGLTINQPTRLNVSGKVSESVSVMAMLSDQDLPLQPEGTTEELEELDRILIRIVGKHLSATLGDYEAGFDETEFVLSPKMLEGAQAQGEFDAGGFTLLGAVSRGKTSSVTFYGVEGQNEYRIDVDGRYIIMIAGSETVWLNGEKMRRGEENDYVIMEYGDPIVEFTNKRMITGNDVIVVDFEYIEEDRNYRQDLYGARGKINLFGSGEGLTLGVSYATESDDKDNPLLLLNDDDIASLKHNELDPDGDGVLLPAPTKQSVIGFDGRFNLGSRTKLNAEIALSKRDLNTFSTYGEVEEGKAWKFNGSSGVDRFRIDFDFRRLDPNFVPIGATFSSRTRATYAEDFDDVSFGEILPVAQATPPGETSYDVDLWCKPVEYVEVAGDLGRTSSEYADDASKRATDHWSRSLKIALPNLPQINSRYQETVTAIDGEDDLKKTRELWKLDHRLWGKLNFGARSENMESVASESSRDRKRETRRLVMDVPTFKKVSLSGEYSFETEYTSSIQHPASSIQYPASSIQHPASSIQHPASSIQHPASSIEHPASRTWSKSSSARTLSTNLSTRPLSWLNFSGYFARRQFSRLAGSADILSASSDSTTNLADLKLNLKWLKINYQIDKKLSTEREEQYVNYIITRMDGEEEKRLLQPGEGNYVKIDEYTYREDVEKGEYIRLVRTVGDRPVTSLNLQSVFSLRPRSSFRARSADVHPSIAARLKKSLSMLEIGAKIGEEQERASRDFYLLQSLQTDKTIYGLRKYWCRTQLSPIQRLTLMANWESGQTINKRINSRTREFNTDRWNIRLESTLTARLSLGGKWEQDDSSETVSGLLEADETGVISDISERQKSRSLFLRYHPSRTLSQVKLEGAYETEWDEDVLSDEPPVFTETISLGAEAAWRFRGKGAITTKYQIASGTSSGKLPFARYDFHEGISHKIKFETSYRLKWFTDVTARFIYRAEITEQEKPDHRLEMEMTANF